MNTEYWDFHVLKSWHDAIYEKCITNESIVGVGDELFVDTVQMINDDNTVQEFIIPYEFRTVVEVNHKGIRYMLPLKYVEHMPLIVTNSFRCNLKKSDKKVYNYVTAIESLSIPRQKGELSFKEFVTQFNPITHTNETDVVIMKLIAMASEFKGIKLCVCSEPSFGKNAHFTVLNSFVSNICRVGQPTLARFENALYYNKVLLPDELTSVAPDKIRELEPAILLIADNSPEYVKHSMANKKKMNATDLLTKSLVFTYNRPKDLDGKKFFEDIWGNVGAFKSRFPQLLLSGTCLDTRVQYSQVQARAMANMYDADIKRQAKMIMYWLHHAQDHMHNWNRDSCPFTGRHATNIQGVIDLFDVYSETQEEFDNWMGILKDRVAEYKSMLVYIEEDKSLNIEYVKVNKR